MIFILAEGLARAKRGMLADMSGDDPSYQFEDTDLSKDEATKELLFEKLSRKQLNTRQLSLQNLELSAEDGKRVGKDVLPF